MAGYDKYKYYTNKVSSLLIGALNLYVALLHGCLFRKSEGKCICQECRDENNCQYATYSVSSDILDAFGILCKRDEGDEVIYSLKNYPDSSYVNQYGIIQLSWIDKSNPILNVTDSYGSAIPSGARLSSMLFRFCEDSLIDELLPHISEWLENKYRTILNDPTECGEILYQNIRLAREAESNLIGCNYDGIRNNHYDLDEFNREMTQQIKQHGKLILNSTTIEQSLPPAKTAKTKRRTERGHAAEKIISALIQHHEYESENTGSVGNPTPISVRKLAEKASVAPSTVSVFLNNEFHGYDAYKRQCCIDSALLIASLRLLNKDFKPGHLQRPVEKCGGRSGG